MGDTVLTAPLILTFSNVLFILQGLPECKVWTASLGRAAADVSRRGPRREAEAAQGGTLPRLQSGEVLGFTSRGSTQHAARRSPEPEGRGRDARWRETRRDAHTQNSQDPGDQGPP